MSNSNVIFRALTKEERINKKMFRSLKKIPEAEETKLNIELIIDDSTGDELEIYFRALTKEERLNKPMFRALEVHNEMRRYVITKDELESRFLALGCSSSEQGISRPVHSKSQNKVKHKYLTTIYVDKEPTKCPLCAKYFKERYEQHKKRREENQCCACWQSFNSEMELVAHVEKFALNKKCCSCDHHFITFNIKSYAKFETDEQFCKHISNCFNYKKAVIKRRNLKN